MRVDGATVLLFGKRRAVKRTYESALLPEPDKAVAWSSIKTMRPKKSAICVSCANADGVFVRNYAFGAG